MLLKFKFVQLTYHLDDKDIDENSNILDVKKWIGSQLNVEYERIKVVYMGKILSEEQIIKDTIQENNNAIHLVIGKSTKKVDSNNNQPEYTQEQLNKIEMLLSLQIINDKKQIINLLKDNQWNVDIVSNLLFEFM